MRFFKREKKEGFSPQLIDLVDYEMKLLYCKKHGKKPIPVMPIANSSKGWSPSELQYMRENRERAREILEEIYG